MLIELFGVVLEKGSVYVLIVDGRGSHVTRTVLSYQCRIKQDDQELLGAAGSREMI
jgi:acyl-coenzyme A thioesterase PaaI-like protein